MMGRKITTLVLLVLAAAVTCAAVCFHFRADTDSVKTGKKAAETEIMTGNDSTTDRLDYYELLPGTVININTADADTLEKLPGIGEGLAAAIIEYRESEGLFKSAEEIMNVKGIGESRYEAIREYITIGDNP